MKNNTKLMLLNLQLFAEGTGGAVASGGDGGTGADATKGVTETATESQKKGSKNPLANVKYGVQPNETTTVEDVAPVSEVQTEDRQAKFEQLIKGEYKDLYDARVQDTIQKRLKGTNEIKSKYESLAPTLELLARKYGVDASDINALNNAIQDDDSYWEEEAMEKGMSVEQLKEMKKLEKENAEFRRAEDERRNKEQTDKLLAQMIEQEQQAKAIYPNLDLRTELQNENFQRLIRSGIDVKTAFEVIHKDEILPAAMQYAAKTTEQKVVNNIRANGMRPKENGLSSQGASEVKSDVSQLTKADRDEVVRRVMRGEKISFTNR